jgi:hypothetical protein
MFFSKKHAYYRLRRPDVYGTILEEEWVVMKAVQQKKY